MDLINILKDLNELQRLQLESMRNHHQSLIEVGKIIHRDLGDGCKWCHEAIAEADGYCSLECKFGDEDRRMDFEIEGTEE